MNVIKVIIGNAREYIQADDEKLVVVGEMQRGGATQLNSIHNKLTAVYIKLKSVLKAIAEVITIEVKDIDASKHPE